MNVLMILLPQGDLTQHTKTGVKKNIIVKVSSRDDDDSRVKIETGNGAGNQLVTLLKQFSQQ